MVGTMAMYHKGMNMKCYRNPVLKAFSADLVATFKHMDQIYEATSEIRMEFFGQQLIGHHSSDNYQEYHVCVVQSEGKSGIMHTGMVYNYVCAREYYKPPGTIVRNMDGSL